MRRIDPFVFGSTFLASLSLKWFTKFAYVELYMGYTFCMVLLRLFLDNTISMLILNLFYEIIGSISALAMLFESPAKCLLCVVDLLSMYTYKFRLNVCVSSNG